VSCWSGAGRVEDTGEAPRRRPSRASGSGNILVELDMLGERALTTCSAEQLGLPVVDLRRSEIDTEVVAAPRRGRRTQRARSRHTVDGTAYRGRGRRPLLNEPRYAVDRAARFTGSDQVAVRSDLEQALTRYYAPSADLATRWHVVARSKASKATQTPGHHGAKRRRREPHLIVKSSRDPGKKAVLDRASEAAHRNPWPTAYGSGSHRRPRCTDTQRCRNRWAASLVSRTIKVTVRPMPNHTSSAGVARRSDGGHHRAMRSRRARLDNARRRSARKE